MLDTEHELVQSALHNELRGDWGTAALYWRTAESAYVRTRGQSAGRVYLDAAFRCACFATALAALGRGRLG